MYIYVCKTYEQGITIYGWQWAACFCYRCHLGFARLPPVPCPNPVPPSCPCPDHCSSATTSTIATTNCCSLSHHVPITVLQHVCMRKFCVFFLLISVTLGRPHISYMMMVCAIVVKLFCRYIGG